MIIIFTPGDRPNPPKRGNTSTSHGSHQPRFASSRPVPDVRPEDEAVFTDPFGPPDASDR
jgi:hypothetical protein